MTQPKKKLQIPHFDSYQEEAKFWDTHDITDFVDELKPVNVRFIPQLTQALSIRFDEETLKAIRYRAQKKGLGPTTYIRMLVMESLSNSSP